MKPLMWAAIAGAATAVGLLIFKKEKPAAPPPGPDSTKTYGEAPIAQSIPAGWRRVTSSEVAALPELQAAATTLRNTPGFTSMQYGTITPFVASDGRTYATWIEQHYHPPGGTLKPWGYHHGATLLAKI